MYSSFLKNGSDFIFLHAIIKSVSDIIKTYFSTIIKKSTLKNGRYMFELGKFLVLPDILEHDFEVP